MCSMHPTTHKLKRSTLDSTSLSIAAGDWMRIWPLQWLSVVYWCIESVLFPDISGSNLQTPKGWKTWWAAGAGINPMCVLQAPPTTAPRGSTVLFANGRLPRGSLFRSSEINFTWRSRRIYFECTTYIGHSGNKKSWRQLSEKTVEQTPKRWKNLLGRYLHLQGAWFISRKHYHEGRIQ